MYWSLLTYLDEEVPPSNPLKPNKGYSHQRFQLSYEAANRWVQHLMAPGCVAQHRISHAIFKASCGDSWDWAKKHFSAHLFGGGSAADITTSQLSYLPE